MQVPPAPPPFWSAELIGLLTLAAAVAAVAATFVVTHWTNKNARILARDSAKRDYKLAELKPVMHKLSAIRLWANTPRFEFTFIEDNQEFYRKQATVAENYASEFESGSVAHAVGDSIPLSLRAMDVRWALNAFAMALHRLGEQGSIAGPLLITEGYESVNLTRGFLLKVRQDILDGTTTLKNGLETMVFELDDDQPSLFRRAWQSATVGDRGHQPDSSNKLHRR